jgi:hypothetical protein
MGRRSEGGSRKSGESPHQVRQRHRHEPPGRGEERLAGRSLVEALPKEQGEHADLGRRPGVAAGVPVLPEEGDDEEHEEA